MAFFELPLESFDTDEYSSPIQIGSITLILHYMWPVEIQQLYDNQISVINDQIKSTPFISSLDLNNIIHTVFSFDLIKSWAQFINQWNNLDKDGALSTVNSTIWPFLLKDALVSFLADNNNGDLYNGMNNFMAALQPVLEYIADLDEKLIWSLEIINGEDRRVTCINPNVWIFYTEPDYRICFYTLATRINRDNLNQCTLYIVQGEENI